MEPETIKEVNFNLSYSDANESDVPSIIGVQQQTWIATYVNLELGITKEAVEERVAGFNNQERIDRYQESIRNNPKLHIWVAKDGETVIGFCMAEKQEERRS